MTLAHGYFCGNCREVYSAEDFLGIYDRFTGETKRICKICYYTNPKKWHEPKIMSAQAKDNYISAHRSRARILGIPATLTLEEWNQTKAHFNHLCAYCQLLSVACLEHFAPLKLGLGTTQYNCVPSCQKCNMLKSGLHPALVKRIPKEDIERVRNYLFTRL